MRALKLKSKLLLSFTVAVVAVMTAMTLIATDVTKKSLTDNLTSALSVISQIAAQAVVAGLEFEDEESIANSLKAFTTQDLFSYLNIKNKDGKDLFYYRQAGFKEISPETIELRQEAGNEIFNEMPIVWNGEKIGTLAIGVSTLESNENANSARLTMLAIAGALIALFIMLASLIANQITRPIKDITQIAESLAQGNLEQEIAVSGKDEIGELADSFRKMVTANKTKAEVANQIAQGSLAIEIEAQSGEDVLAGAMATMKESLSALLAELQSIIDRQKAGDLDARCEPGKLNGAFADVLDGVNDTLDAITEPVSEGINILNEYAVGILLQEMRTLPGKQQILTDGLNSIRENLQALINEGTMLAGAAEDGRLQTRGNLSRFEGGYREIIQGINDIIENILNPVSEARDCLQAMASGNLRVRVDGSYKGDHAIMKDAMNGMLNSLNKLLTEVTQTAEQVSAGAGKILNSSNTLSTRAVQQASFLQEISASLADIASQTKQNAGNAASADKIAENTRAKVSQGNSQMEKMLKAMNDIHTSSREISKIVKSIDEIAFQTNLLSLNASVEAARAGIHGKGFAVVAEEVRNLALKSAKAAKETTELINNSVQKVENGTLIANDTAKDLDEILVGVNKFSDLSSEIATACSEQAKGLDEINSGMSKIDNVTHENTANAQDGTEIAQELSNQSANLKQLLSKFQLRDPAADHHSDKATHETPDFILIDK